MHFTTEIDKERRLTYTRVTGSIAPRVFREALTHAFWREDFDPTYSLIVDLTGLDGVPLIEETREVYRVFRVLRDSFKGKIAVVAPDIVSHTLAQLVAMLAAQEGVRLEAFRSVDKAREWLGVE